MMRWPSRRAPACSPISGRRISPVVPYPTLEDFLGHVAEILCGEVDMLARHGARYIQIDAPHYPLLLDAAMRAIYESRGWSMAEWLELGKELDNLVMSGATDVTFGLHLCRGNQGGRWLVAGGYDAIAKPLFQRSNAHRLLLEYDDSRAGSFAPLPPCPMTKSSCSVWSPPSGVR